MYVCSSSAEATGRNERISQVIRQHMIKSTTISVKHGLLVDMTVLF